MGLAVESCVCACEAADPRGVACWTFGSCTSTVYSDSASCLLASGICTEVFLPVQAQRDMQSQTNVRTGLIPIVTERNRVETTCTSVLV